MNWGDINNFAKQPVSKSDYLCNLYFLNTERNMSVNKTFIRRLGHLLNALYTLVLSSKSFMYVQFMFCIQGVT